MHKVILSSVIPFGFLLFSAMTHAETYDEALLKQLKFFNVLPLQEKKAVGSDVHKIEMGKRLFLDTNLSGNRRVSCFSCHAPSTGTSDARPFSLTEDLNSVVKRNAQSLFNLKTSGDRFYFWDGRVEFIKEKHQFMTPERALNGENPSAKDIVMELEDGLSAQAIFPLVSREEMRGNVGDNEIADEKDNVGAWGKIVERIQTDVETYFDLFNKAFPGKKFHEMNIGHVGSALSRFMEYEFYSWDSPLNRFVAGDMGALSLKEKKGLEVFLGRGRCIACHQGSHFALNNFFTNVGVPELASSQLSRDLGRFEVTGQSFEKFFYKVPSLKNVALTAPYFHNGAKRTLREVVDHYNSVNTSIDNYKIPLTYERTSVVSLKVFDTPDEKRQLKSSVQAGFLRHGLGLSEEEKDNLVTFLEVSLTDPKFKNYLRSGNFSTAPRSLSSASK